MGDRPDRMDTLTVRKAVQESAYCTTCGQENYPDARLCTKCNAHMPATVYNYGRLSDGPDAIYTDTMDRRRAFGVTGAVLLALGAFVPLVEIPIFGNLSFVFNSGTDNYTGTPGVSTGIVILALAIISLILVLRGNNIYLWGTSILAFAITIYTFANVNRVIADYIRKNPGDPLVGSIEISWGWAVLLISELLIMIAAAPLAVKKLRAY